MNNNRALVQKFFETDPYEGFEYLQHQCDLQGWGYENPILYDAIKLIRPSLIFEVGSWKGASAIRMAQCLREQGIPGCIICVDTWLGAPEHFMVRDHADYFQSLKFKHGYPQLYYQFLANVMHSGVQDIIVPLAQTSGNAATILKELGLKANLIYIDGSHNYTDVYLDLREYWELLTLDGVLIGDDYHFIWHGVVRAVKQFSKERGLRYFLSKEKFLFRKSEKFQLDPCVEEKDLYWDGEAGEYRALPSQFRP